LKDAHVTQVSSGCQEGLGALVARHLGRALPSHRELVVHSLETQLQLFSEASTAGAALWVQLARRGGGLRQVSAEWIAAADNLVRRADVAPSTEALFGATPADPHLAYRLGQLAIAGELLSGRQDYEAQILRLRIELASATIGQDIQQRIEALEDAASEAIQEGLLASYIVKAAKRRLRIDPVLEARLASWLERTASRTTSDDALVRGCHVANSLNFVRLKRGELDRVESYIAVVEGTLAPRIQDRNRRNHILGNASFHRSMLARITKNPDAELAAASAALRLDPGFTDYDYRIAQILHDRGDRTAQLHYEAALRMSPMNFSLVNDYGCCLSEFSPADLDSWERVARFFFPNPQPEQQ
jgi:tetratricopeptide (TPR) repeat protein